MSRAAVRQPSSQQAIGRERFIREEGGADCAIKADMRTGDATTEIAATSHFPWSVVRRHYRRP